MKKKNTPDKKIDGTTLTEKEYKTLDRLYTTFSKNNTASFGGVAALQKSSKLSRSKVQEYLHSNQTYTILKTRHRAFKRLGVFSPAIDEIWSIDLAYVDKLALDNDNIKYLMVAVDVQLIKNS